MGLVRIACWPELSPNMPDVAAVLDKLREVEAPPAQWLIDLMPIPGLSGDGAESVHRFQAMLAGFDHSASPWAVLATTLLDRTRIAAGIASSEDVGQKTRGKVIWQFVNFVRVQPEGRGHKTDAPRIHSREQSESTVDSVDRKLATHLMHDSSCGAFGRFSSEQALTAHLRVSIRFHCS